MTDREWLEAELERSRTSLAVTQELGNVGSWSYDVPSGRLTWSRETCRIYGVDPDGPRPHPAPAAWLAEDRLRVARIIREAARERRMWEAEFRILRPNGDVRAVHGKGQPVLDANGRVVEWRGVVIDVTDRKRAERALRRSRKRAIEARFVAKLAERTRLAREIHDTLLQGFTGLTLRLRAAAHDLQHDAPIAQALRDIIELAERTMQDARHAVWELRAPALAAGTLADAIRAATTSALAATGLHFRCNVAGRARTVDPRIEEAVLRVVQEAVANVVRHAGATSVSIRLVFGERRLRVAVIDDGRGFADANARPPEGHWGLVGIRERAAQVRGRVTVRSAPGAGTELSLVVPYGATRPLALAAGAGAR